MKADDQSPLIKIPAATAAEVSQRSPEDGSIELGQQEVIYLASGRSENELKKQSEKNEHDRNEKFRDEFECIAIYGLRLFCFLVAGLIVVWFWHVVMPSDSHWLTTDQFAKIQSLATGGIIASIAAGHVKKRLGS
ncbi:hypothetical protein G3A39_41585 [Paraburkholderia aspalathi]|nr:hypothetical protein [Paraburkholderia aspalathi]